MYPPTKVPCSVPGMSAGRTAIRSSEILALRPPAELVLLQSTPPTRLRQPRRKRGELGRVPRLADGLAGSCAAEWVGDGVDAGPITGRPKAAGGSTVIVLSTASVYSWLVSEPTPPRIAALVSSSDSVEPGSPDLRHAVMSSHLAAWP